MLLTKSDCAQMILYRCFSVDPVFWSIAFILEACLRSIFLLFQLSNTIRFQFLACFLLDFFNEAGSVRIRLKLMCTINNALKKFNDARYFFTSPCMLWHCSVQSCFNDIFNCNTSCFLKRKPQFSFFVFCAVLFQSLDKHLMWLYISRYSRIQGKMVLLRIIRDLELSLCT